MVSGGTGQAGQRVVSAVGKAVKSALAYVTIPNLPMGGDPV